MNIIQFKKPKPPDSDDLLIDFIIQQEKIGTINSAIKGLMLISVSFLLCYFVVFCVVMAVPKFVSNVLGL